MFNYEFVLMAGDTIISGTDNSGKDFTYNPNSLQVHINGVLLSATDYTATDGTSIVLNEAAANNNDLAQISTQVKPEGSDDIPSEIDRIDGEISDLDARVTTNEGNIQDNADAIESMQNKAATFTTEDVKVAGTVPSGIVVMIWKRRKILTISSMLTSWLMLPALTPWKPKSQTSSLMI